MEKSAGEVPIYIRGEMIPIVLHADILCVIVSACKESVFEV